MPDDTVDLLRVAALLAGDRAAATDLARAALLAGGGRTELVRRALRTTARRRVDSWLTDEPDLSGDGYAALRAALRGLPPRTRAAVVLGRWAGLADDEIAAMLRSPVGTVRSEVTAGAAVLSATLSPDQELHDALDDLAHALAPSGLPSIPELRGEQRRRRRWQAAVAVGCGAVLVAVVALAGGLSGDEPATADPTATTSTSVRPPEVVDVAQLPTRGSLAGDVEFLAGLRELPWDDVDHVYYPEEVTTAPETRRVLFAGDVPGGRWALLVGRPEFVDPAAFPPDEPAPVLDDLFAAWFGGPPGAEPNEMRLISYPYGYAPGYVPSLHDPRTGTLVVVAAPGDAVEVSPGVEVDADGVDSRNWVPVETTDGVAITRLNPVELPWSWAVSFRVTRDGSEWLTSSPDPVMLSPEELEIGLDGVDYPAPPTEEGRLAAGFAVLAVLGPMGISRDDVDVAVHAVAPVRAPPGGEVALVSVTLPSGAVAVSAQWARTGPEGLQGGADCGLDMRPAGRSPGDGLLAARCELYDAVTGAAAGAVLLLAAPPSVAAVRVYRANRTFLAELVLPEDGVLLVPSPEGASVVEGVTGAGVLLGRVRLLGHWRPAE